MTITKKIFLVALAGAALALIFFYVPWFGVGLLLLALVLGACHQDQAAARLEVEILLALSIGKWMTARDIAVYIQTKRERVGTDTPIHYDAVSEQLIGMCERSLVDAKHGLRGEVEYRITKEGLARLFCEEDADSPA